MRIMNPIEMVLSGTLLCIVVISGLYLINANLKNNKLLKILSNVALSLILVLSLVIFVEGCFKAINERKEYVKFYNSVCLTTEEMERK